MTKVAKVWKADPYNDGSVLLPQYYKDFAVFRVQDPFVFGLRVQPIRISSCYTNVPVGTLATVAGWGPSVKSGDSARHLKAVQAPTVSLKTCREKNRDVDRKNMCTGYEQGGKTFCGVSTIASCTFIF